MSTDLEALRDYLRDRDAACPGCGYNLRGLDADSCPECGRRLRLGLVRGGRASSWWFGLLGLCAGLLVSGLVALFLVGSIVMDNNADEPEAMLAGVLLVGAAGVQAWGLSRWIVGGRPTWGGAAVAWTLGMGPVLALWGVMLGVMAVF